MSQRNITMSRLIFAATLLTMGTALAAPALAQSEGERVNQLIIYGDDACPPSTDGEITVCARKDEAERFRIPAPLRESQSPANEAWNNRVLAYETVGKTGTLSCSPVGAGGSLGCTQHIVDAAFAEKRGAPDVHFAQLIETERARRLSTIDTDAADTQTRVETLERQYEERRKREEDTAAEALPAPGTTKAN
jgi:hypothetical protein